MSNRMDTDPRQPSGTRRVADALVSVSNVTKRYGGSGLPALDGVSLQVAHGEAVAVMGPSG
jgi:ABC-type multidrug transport system ATPase subunit